jgi:hypothetical protein
MISNNRRCLFIINPFLEFKQFENGKANKSKQEKSFYRNKSPEQNSSPNRLKPKKIFYHKRKKKIQQTQTDEENDSPNEFVGVKLPNKKF